MKYRDLFKQKILSNSKRKKISDTTLNNKLWFVQGDVRWFLFLNQWVRSGKRYLIQRVIRQSQDLIRSEYLCSPWLVYRSALWGSRLLLDIKTKKFGRKQVSFPIVVKGTTVYSRPMLYLRKLINLHKSPGLFWIRWNNCLVSSSLGHGPLSSTLENKYVQLAKLQNVWVTKSDFVDYGRGEWIDRLTI